MEKSLTKLELFIFDKLTVRVRNTKECKTKERIIFKCFIAKKKCPKDHIAYSHSLFEINRLFTHFLTCHPDELYSTMLSWFSENNVIDNYPISNCELISNYFKEKIIPIYPLSLQNMYSFNIPKKCYNEKNSIINLSDIDLNRLDQVILETGIFEHLPLETIKSKHHIQFISNLIKLGFELGRNTEITTNEFLKIVNGIHIPKKLLEDVGDDYYEALVSCFKGSYASLLIDAGEVNSVHFLTFVLSSKQRKVPSMLFHLTKNFGCTHNDYVETVKKVIEKARESQINIVGLVTDNLPVQISALSHESSKSLQNKYSDMKSIVHLRCTNHLLALAFWDWMDTKNIFTKYEKKLKKLCAVFNKQNFKSCIKYRIPSMCKVRWNSPFNSLIFLHKNRKKLIALYQNPSYAILSDLNEIKDEMLYLITIGFTQIYPLLFPVLNLTNHLQSDFLSCVDMVLIVE